MAKQVFYLDVNEALLDRQQTQIEELIKLSGGTPQREAWDGIANLLDEIRDVLYEERKKTVAVVLEELDRAISKAEMIPGREAQARRVMAYLRANSDDLAELFCEEEPS